MLDPERRPGLGAAGSTPTPGVPSVAALAEGVDPRATVGGAAALTVTTSGRRAGRLGRRATGWSGSRPRAAGFAEPVTEQPARSTSAPASRSPSVGERGVLLDGETGDLVVVDGGTAALPPGSRAPAARPARATPSWSRRAPSCSTSTSTTGDATALADDLTAGRPRPVRLGACRYGAWSGGARRRRHRLRRRRAAHRLASAPTPPTWCSASTAARSCSTTAPAAPCGTSTPTQPIRIDDWDAFSSDTTERRRGGGGGGPRTQGDRQPPKAKPDDLGARPGRITVLHPLDNDTAPAGRILAIRSRRRGSPARATLSIGPDGQTVQLDAAAPTRSGATTLRLRRRRRPRGGLRPGDGDASVRATLPVERRAVPALGLRAAGVDRAVGRHPRRPGAARLARPARRRPAGPRVGERRGWRDGRGAVARTTASGPGPVHRPRRRGRRARSSTPSATASARRSPSELAIRVQDKPPPSPSPASPSPTSSRARPASRSRSARSATTCPAPTRSPRRPPSSWRARSPSVGGADVRDRPGRGHHHLPLAHGADLPARLRRGLRQRAARGRAHPRRRARAGPQPPDPVAMPDQVTIFGQAATMVDVLANDVDPAGGMLVVQRADARDRRPARRRGRPGPLGARRRRGRGA